jgi:hypothetical protein
MQLKPITAIIVLSLVVASLFVLGCTTPASNPTASPSSITSPSATSVDMATKLNKAFTAQNFIIVKPFSQAVNQYGNVVYTGVVKDGEGKVVPYVHNMTVEETKSRNETITRFNAYVAQALSQGYPQESGNSTDLWYSFILNGGSDATKQASVRINEPNRGVLFWFGVGVSVSDPNYTVAVQYSTKA